MIGECAVVDDVSDDEGHCNSVRLGDKKTRSRASEAPTENGDRIFSVNFL